MPPTATRPRIPAGSPSLRQQPQDLQPVSRPGRQLQDHQLQGLGAETTGAGTMGAETTGAGTMGAETTGAGTTGAETTGAGTTGAGTTEAVSPL